MKQHEAVILTLEKLGGQATLGQLYQEVMKIQVCKWGTKTPFASIRRIVQKRPEIFKVKPGLWALKSYQQRLSLEEYNPNVDKKEQTHAYFQGLIASIGNFRMFQTYIPNQDKNKLFIIEPLEKIRSLQVLPTFSFTEIIKRSSTIDVIWFNQRSMPHSFFEVEHNTDMHNALLKFFDLQDFNSRMIIVADEHRRREFDSKMKMKAFDEISSRVKFLGYVSLVRQYELEIYKSTQPFAL